MANGLSDHTPMMVYFPTTTKTKNRFQFCEMWCKHHDFNRIVESVVDSSLPPVTNEALRHLRTKGSDQHSNANPSNSGDSSLFQAESYIRSKYNDILTSSMALMQQQSKIEWINYGDDNSRIFFAKAKQRKLASYIYNIKDARGDLVEGLTRLGRQCNHITWISWESRTLSEVVYQGPVLNMDQQLHMCRDFTDLDIKEALICIPNFKFPGPDEFNSVLITASRLTKVECASLVEKIMSRVQIWATRNISFAGRARFINSVIFRMYSYWASIFLLSTEVTKKITQICRNYLWTGVKSTIYILTPNLLAKITRGNRHKGSCCLEQSHSSQAHLGRSTKKEVPWVKWVHERYLKNKLWWDYTPSQDASWYWKKICKIKEEFKQGDAKYKVTKGYNWLRGEHEKVPWAKTLWARPVIPEHAFISWVMAHHRLPTKQRLAKFIPQNETLCIMCSEADEDEMHLFFTCNYAKIIWRNLRGWWKFIPEMSNSTQMFRSLAQIKGTRTQKQITCAIVAAAVYYIWSARNHTIFKQQKITPTQSIHRIKD
ncbi:hypothetical protein Cgig2_002214 [Carnegiea gigantea]|uniref:Reverse transcriptase zinc-binding domain-containing protein n=1 Tax=Carnegiea gigantea TaxID=171969 RepID=A0A9Q1GXL4_9CARY|nr:hypothetical protein Cgig2_002214 [Carnegiea gigantea]